MNSQYQVKTMLIEKAAMLQKHGSELSGKKFRNHTVERKIFTDSKKCLPGAPHIHRDGVRGKKFFSPKAEDQITENSVMVASFVNRQRKSTKIWLKKIKIFRAEISST